jgi:hypothetical protein
VPEEDAGVGVGVAALLVFEEELPHETERIDSRDNANAVKQKLFFIMASIINSRL